MEEHESKILKHMKCIIPKEDCHIAMNIVNSRAATKIESIISKS
jgi:hypothetical protein